MFASLCITLWTNKILLILFLNSGYKIWIISTEDCNTITDVRVNDNCDNDNESNHDNDMWRE